MITNEAFINVKMADKVIDIILLGKKLPLANLLFVDSYFNRYHIKSNFLNIITFQYLRN